MTIEFRSMNGDTHTIDVGPGTVLDNLIKKGITDIPPEEIDILDGKEVVNNQELSNFKGKTLNIVMKRTAGAAIKLIVSKIWTTAKHGAIVLGLLESCD